MVTPLGALVPYNREEGKKGRKTESAADADLLNIWSPGSNLYH